MDENGSHDGILALGVLRVYFTIVAVHYIDILVDYQVSLETVPLMGIQVDNHDSSYQGSALEVVHDQRNIRVDAESSPVPVAGMVETA